MLHRTTRMVLIASILSSMGAHLPVIQSIAWARMAMTYSQSCSLPTSLQKTFDGRHPCGLCLKVKQATQSGPSLGVSPTENRLDAALLSVIPQIKRVDIAWSLAPALLSAYCYAALLHSPPPKEIFA